MTVAARGRSARLAPRVAVVAPAFAALAFAVLTVLATPAAAHDGAIRWRSVVAPHVAVHFPAGYEAFAREVATLAEAAFADLAWLLPYRQPRRLELTIDDYSDGSNGFAINFPYDHVHLYAAPPRVGSDLEGNGDWLRALVYHEVSHILHMGQASGPPDWLNAVLGRVYLPNANLPRFWLEGLATWVETQFVGGRVGGAVFSARLRAALLDDQWPGLDRLTGEPLKWPRGRGWYVFGSWLLDHQLRRHGAPATRAFVADMGRQIIPYAINVLYRRHFGRSAVRMWHQAKAEMATMAAAEATLRARGVVPPTLPDEATAAVARWRGRPERPLAVARRLSRDGEWRGRVRPHPDGVSVVVPRGGEGDLARIERVTVASGKATVLHVCESDCDDPLLTPDARWLLFVGSRPDHLVYRPGEVMAVPLGADGRGPGAASADAGKGALRLGRRWRAREIAVDPSGRWLALVRIDRGRTAVHVLRLDRALAAARAGHSVALGPAVATSRHPREILGTPALLPAASATTGPRLLWTRGEGLQREIVSVDLDRQGRPQGPLQVRGRLPLRGVVTADGAAARPDWVGDLQTVRDAAGSWRLAAVVQVGSFRDVASLPVEATQAAWTAHSWSPTGVASAALLPSGEAVVVEHRGNGMDLVVSRAAASPPDGARVAPSITAAAEDAARPKARRSARPALALREQPYDPWPTLRPFSYRPAFEAGAMGDTFEAEKVVIGVDMGGRDALELYRWSLVFRTDLTFQRPYAVLTLNTARWRPNWALTAATIPSTAFSTRGFSYQSYATRQVNVRLSGALAIPGARDGWSIDASVGLGRTIFDERAAAWLARTLRDEPFGPEPLHLDLAGLGDVAIGIAYGRSERYPNSVVAERVRALSLALTAALPELGDDDRALRVDLSGRQSFRLGKHRVLALRGRLGHGLIVPPGQRPYRVVGIGPTDVTALLAGPGGGDFGAVRGLLDAQRDGRKLAGRSLGWGSAELHWPLLDLGHGFDTLPLWLGRLWAVVFVDAAGVLAGDEARLRAVTTASGVAGSAGVELRLGVDTGYLPLGTLRLGAAAIHGGAEGFASWIRLGY